MMNGRQSTASDLFWDAWENGGTIDQLPQHCAPQTRTDGYAAQADYAARSTAPRAGWKIAATSAAGQHHINVDGPIAGRLLPERILSDGAAISLTNNRMLVAEPEFGFRFGVNLPSGQIYSRETVEVAISTMHLTLEIPDSRFTDFTAVGAPSLIADNACARELVVSEAVRADWRVVDLATHPVRASIKNRFERDGSGAAVLGHPLDALTWLVNEVTGLGIEIQAGELVTTGTCMVPLEIAPGDQFTADYGPFGTISASFV